MDQPSLQLFEDALRTLDGYHRALMIKPPPCRSTAREAMPAPEKKWNNGGKNK